VRKLLVKMSMATLVGLPAPALPLGLGEIEVESFLNQPLNAEIDVISVRPGEIDDLLVGLAKREDFRRAGLARPSVLDELKFTVQANEAGTEASVRVSTKTAVREPFLNFLVEADWADGRVIREFTILLDPPHIAEYFNNQPAAPTPAAAVTEPALASFTPEPGTAVESNTFASAPAGNSFAAPTAAAEPSYYDQLAEPSLAELQNLNTLAPAPIAQVSEPQPASIDAPLSQTPETSQPDSQVINKGDTLWSIASQYQQDGQSMSQIMLAFQRVNPEAFTQDNINGMKVGQVLRVPAAEDIEALNQQQAYAQVLEQNGLWDAYLARVSGASTQQVAEGGVTGESLQAKDAELKLVAPGDEGDGASNSADARKQMILLEDELEAATVENQELRSRIGDLESQIEKLQQMQNLVEMQSDTLAQLQQEQAEQPPLEVMPETSEVMPETELQPDMPAEADPVTEVMESESTEMEVVAPEVVELVENNAVDTTEADVEIVPPQTVTPSVTSSPVIITEPAAKKPGLLDQIFANPLILAAGGGVLVLLLALLLVLQKRRKASPDDAQEPLSTAAEEDPLLDDDSTPIHLPADETHNTETDLAAVEATIDETELPSVTDESEDGFGKTTILSSEPLLEEEASAAPAEEEEDDVLSEANVYLAYGLYDNAEDLLKTNIEQNPGKVAYRSKLLDTFFAVQNADAFVAAAQELKDMGAVADPYWERVQVMGYELAPEHDLFSGAASSGLSAADLDFAKPEAADIDLGAGDSPDAATDFDLGADFDLSEETDGTFDSTQVISADNAPNLLDDSEDETLIRGEEGDSASLMDELPESLDLDFDTEDQKPDEDVLDSEASLEISSLAADENALEFDLGADDLGIGEPEAEESIDHGDNVLDFDFEDMAAEVTDETGEDAADTEAVEETLAATEIVDSAGDLEDDLGSLNLDLPADDVLSDDPNDDIAEIDMSDMDISLDDALEPVEALAETELVQEPELDSEDSLDIDVNMDDLDIDIADAGMDLPLDAEVAEASDDAVIEEENSANEEMLEVPDVSLDEIDQDFVETLVADEADLAALGQDAEMDLTAEDIAIDLGEEALEDIGMEDASTETEADVDDEEAALLDQMVETGVFAPGDFDQPEEEAASETETGTDDLESEAAVADELTDFDLEELMVPDGFDEVGNKLDLAKAFIELGDADAARSSLEEVLEEGSEEQKQEAQEMLGQL